MPCRTVAMVSGSTGSEGRTGCCSGTRGMSSSRTDVRSTLPKWGITFQVPATILCSSVIKYMTTAHDQFVAPQERAIGAGFAAQGRTELSLQRAALDSASAARRRCSSDHGDGRLRPHHQNPNAQRGQVDPNPKHSNRQKRIPNKSPPKKKGSFFFCPSPLSFRQVDQHALACCILPVN